MPVATLMLANDEESSSAYKNVSIDAPMPISSIESAEPASTRYRATTAARAASAVSGRTIRGASIS